MGKTLATLALAGVLFLSGCGDESPSKNASSISKILKSKEKTAVLHSEVILNKNNSHYVD